MTAIRGRLAEITGCQSPRLGVDEIQDVAAFLGTLIDGYDTAADSADPARSIKRTTTD